MLFQRSSGAQQRRLTLARPQSGAESGQTLRLVFMASFALLGAVALAPQEAAQANPCRSINNPAITTPPDANAQMVMHQQQTAQQQQNYAAANAERKKQISSDSAQLLKLATELKNEVDKTTKDTLSLNVIRKADEIERLAHSVKEKMKLTAGGS
jgi:hypothetical protein